ncbi:MAG: tetratricopeptide repeat protein [Deltaproteobacteria bacterium]|nr:tetratricopeptide repeat protein [Deltaproteobacteria bacterium]
MKKYLMIVILAMILFPSLLFADAVLDKEKEEAITLNNQAIDVFKKTKKYEEAISYAKKALAIREKVFGRDHPEVSQILDTLGWLGYSAERYKEAEPFYQRSLEIKEKAFGQRDARVALTLWYLAHIRRNMERYGEAESLYKRALSIYESGGDDINAASINNDLARIYYQMGRHAETESHYRKALTLRENALGSEHQSTVAVLNNLALFYYWTLRYRDAEPLFERVLGIKEKTLGKQNPDIDVYLNNLAYVSQDLGKYGEAEKLYKRLLEIRERKFGKEHLQVAESLKDIAFLNFKTGKYTEAESLYKRALAIVEKTPDQGTIAAQVLNNMGILYDSVGKSVEAESLFKRALGIREKVLGKDHIDVGETLDNLALLYSNTGRYNEARQLHSRASVIYAGALERRYGNMARLRDLFSKNLNNITLLYYRAGNFTEAERTQKIILDINTRIFGNEHPQVAASLYNLAEIYVMTGKYREAGSYYHTALAIREKLMGKNHSDVADTLLGMARLYAVLEKHGESHRLFLRGITIHETAREEHFMILAESQKLNYLKQHESDIYSYISHTLLYMKYDDAAITDAFNMWVRWKGAVTETQGRYLDAVLYSSFLHYGGGKDIRKMFDTLAQVRREIARLQFSKSDEGAVAERLTKIGELEKRKEFLEAELNKLSREYSLEGIGGERADVKKIMELLPPDSIYIDFAKIRPYNFKKGTWDKFRYYIFLMIPGGKPVIKLFDIADAEELDGHVSAYLREMNKVKTTRRLPDPVILNTEARSIYLLTMKPVERYLKGRKMLLISPDGNLNLIPFGVLVTPKNRYLVEDHVIDYIAAGRDILRFADATTAEGESVIIADPDYNLGMKDMQEVVKTVGFKGIRVGGQLSRDALEMHFDPLPDTKREADAIGKILTDRLKIRVKSYQGAMAVEDILYRAEHPKILHLATHGYFLKEQELKDRDLRGVTIKIKEEIGQGGGLNMENPMLRSGIALAGVNSSLREGRDEGLLSAEKIMGLRLKGTDLVVLSACETGVGDVQSGEGVFGLKRAFILSGAKTLVMSLWSVPSQETTELMTDFYDHMAKGKSKAEALREANLRMLRKKNNPFFWAAFVMVGNPH